MSIQQAAGRSSMQDCLFLVCHCSLDMNRDGRTRIVLQVDHRRQQASHAGCDMPSWSLNGKVYFPLNLFYS